MFHLSGAKGHFSALIAFCAAPLILAACGSSPTPTPAPTSTRPPSTPTIAATAAATPVATGTPSAAVSMAAGTSVTVQMQAQSGSGHRRGDADGCWWHPDQGRGKPFTWAGRRDDYPAGAYPFRHVRGPRRYRLWAE